MQKSITNHNRQKPKASSVPKFRRTWALMRKAVLAIRNRLIDSDLSLEEWARIEYRRRGPRASDFDSKGFR